MRRRHPRRQRGSEGAGRLGEWRGDDSAARGGAGRLGERSGGDSAARRAPGGSESGEDATAQLGGRRAARRAERRRLRGYEGRRGGSAVTQFIEKTRTVAEKRLPIFKYSARGARITSS